MPFVPIISRPPSRFSELMCNLEMTLEQEEVPQALNRCVRFLRIRVHIRVTLGQDNIPASSSCDRKQEQNLVTAQKQVEEPIFHRSWART